MNKGKNQQPAAAERPRRTRTLEEYRKLKAWPQMPHAVAVHLNAGEASGTRVRVPVRLMRACGLRPDIGVDVAIHKDRVLITGDERGGPIRQDAESKQMVLQKSALPESFNMSNYAIVQGANYLVLTSAADARKLGGKTAPIVEATPWERVMGELVPSLDTPFDGSDLKIVHWNDIRIGHTTRLRRSSIAQVGGRIWWLAGFKAGDPLKFTRYADATVIERGTQTDKHSTLCQGRQRGVPRHYVGPSLFDVHSHEKVRVVATADRLIITTMDSALSKRCAPIEPTLCSKQPCMHVPTIQKVVDTAKMAAKQEILDGDCGWPKTTRGFKSLKASALDVLSFRDYVVKDTRVDIMGHIWTIAGFAVNTPARVVRYANALVIEACSEAQMDFRTGSPGQEYPYRKLWLKEYGLGKIKAARVLVVRGRLVLVAPDGKLADSVCKDVLPFPTRSRDTLVRQVKTPAELPVAEVGQYTVPEGRRLQVQGKWLRDLGFTPGTKFNVAERAGELRLVVDNEGACTVTEHSPGSPKLYVASQSLASLNATQVRVSGRKGMLQLVPMAA